MARYIIDTSVLCQYFITQTYTAEAIILIQSVFQDNELFVPEFALAECVNVFWKYVRFQGLAENTAKEFVQELMNLPLQVNLISDLLSNSLEIGLSQSLAIYDSVYIAMALDSSYPLITVDVKQANAATANGVTLKPIIDFS